jgi:hypothetical protein
MSRLVDDLYICSDCTLISSDISPDASIYDKSYVLKYQRYEKTVTNRNINEYRFGRIPSGTKGLLDYGCGVGSFVKYCNINGLVAHGYDLNPYGDYCDPAILMDEYDTVSFWDSIEHIVDPVRLIRGIGARSIVISTPSTDDFKGKKSDIPKWRHYMPEEHVHYFNEKSLRALLESAGYEVVFVDYGESEFRQGGGDKNIITIGGSIGSY